MIHVADLAQGLVGAAQSPAGAGTWFLTDGEAHSWAEIASALSIAADRRVRVLTVPDALVQLAGTINQFAHRVVGASALFDRAKARDFPSKGWVCSSESAESAFDYAPGVGLVDGMSETMEWYRREKWL